MTSWKPPHSEVEPPELGDGLRKWRQLDGALAIIGAPGDFHGHGGYPMDGFCSGKSHSKLVIWGVPPISGNSHLVFALKLWFDKVEKQCSDALDEWWKIFFGWIGLHIFFPGICSIEWCRMWNSFTVMNYPQADRSMGSRTCSASVVSKPRIKAMGYPWMGGRFCPQAWRSR